MVIKYITIIFSLITLTGASSHGAACWPTSPHKNNTKKIKFLAQKKQINHDQAELFMAATDNNVGALEHAIHNGADVNTQDKNGRTPLMDAVVTDNVLAVEVLLANGADVNARNKKGDTPLKMAIRVNNGQRIMALTHNESGYRLVSWDEGTTINLLLEKNADVNAANNNGETPLMAAARAANKQAVQILLNGGADISQTNTKGETALDLVALSAQQSPQCLDHPDIKQMLLHSKPTQDDDRSVSQDESNSDSQTSE